VFHRSSRGISKPIADGEHGKLRATIMHYVASGGLWRSQSGKLPGHLHHVIGAGRRSGLCLRTFSLDRFVRYLKRNNHMRYVSHRKQNRCT